MESRLDSMVYVSAWTAVLGRDSECGGFCERNQWPFVTPQFSPLPLTVAFCWY